MHSRYAYMKESKTVDSETFEAYPDPLSINFSKIQLSEIPTLQTLSKGDLQRFWLFIYNFYKFAEGDDIILTLNNIPYIGMLSPGDSLYLPVQNDIYATRFET